MPERDQLAFVHDFVARHVAGFQFNPVDARDVPIDLAVQMLPDDAIIGTASYPALRGERTRELLGDGRDNYLLTIHTHEHEVSVEGRPPVKVNAGDVMIVNQGCQFEFRIPSTVVKVLSLGREKMASLVPRIDLEHSYHLSGEAPGAKLMAGYADLLRQLPPLDDGARAVVAGHMYDLVALALDGVVNGGAGRGGHGIKAARLELVKRDILERLRNPALTIESVARRQGVSPRYIHRLFEGEGMTFSEFVRDSRLELAYGLLSRSAIGDTTISAIAFDAGFCDLSSFNRAFRRRYGMTPSELRSRAMRARDN